MGFTIPRTARNRRCYGCIVPLTGGTPDAGANRLYRALVAAGIGRVADPVDFAARRAARPYSAAFSRCGAALGAEGRRYRYRSHALVVAAVAYAGRGCGYHWPCRAGLEPAR